MPTYYDVLQVERDAPPERIRAAWRKLAQKYHPDKLPDNANASRAMAAINAAYAVLSDPHERARHDRWIDQAESRPSRLEPVNTEPQTFWGMLNPVTGWPWYLLFATMAFALGTVGTAVYLTAMPARLPSATAPHGPVKHKTQAPQAEPRTGGLKLPESV
ncbi:MAG: J domain-containing protein [Burkholderiales bacterium]|nr:J domain-containing protein [Burkholderiales bacterium]